MLLASLIPWVLSQTRQSYVSENSRTLWQIECTYGSSALNQVRSKSGTIWYPLSTQNSLRKRQVHLTRVRMYETICRQGLGPLHQKISQERTRLLWSSQTRSFNQYMPSHIMMNNNFPGESLVPLLLQPDVSIETDVQFVRKTSKSSRTITTVPFSRKRLVTQQLRKARRQGSRARRSLFKVRSQAKI